MIDDLQTMCTNAQLIVELPIALVIAVVAKLVADELSAHADWIATEILIDEAGSFILEPEKTNYVKRWEDELERKKEPLEKLLFGMWCILIAMPLGLRVAFEHIPSTCRRQFGLMQYRIRHSLRRKLRELAAQAWEMLVEMFAIASAIALVAAFLGVIVWAGDQYGPTLFCLIMPVLAWYCRWHDRRNRRRARRVVTQ